MPRRTLDPQNIAAAKLLSETTALSRAAIARRSGVSAASLSRLARREDWRRPDGADRQRLLRRLWTLAERQAEWLEARGEADDFAALSRELAGLAKVLRDLAALQSEAPAQAATAPPDMAQLRETIRARLARLHAAEADGG